MILKNYTPHTISFYGEGDKVLFTVDPELDGPARVDESSRQVDALNFHNLFVPIKIFNYNDVVGKVPAPSPNTYFIVSRIVAEHLPYREDLLVPYDLVYDGNGFIVGCRSFASLAKRYVDTKMRKMYAS